MPSLIAPTQLATPRELLMWAVLGTLAAGILVAFYSLCSDQVEKAQMRDQSAKVRSVAFADCLVSIPNSTFQSCASGNRSQQGNPAQATAQASFSFR